MLVSAVAGGVLAQGLICIDNHVNTSLDQAAVSNGLFWNGNALLNVDANLTLLAGPSADSLAPLKTFLVSNGSAVGSSAFGPGTWSDLSGNSYPVPGVPPGGTAYLQVQIWLGNYSSFYAAVGRETLSSQSSVFTQVLGGGSLIPPDLTGMPAVNLLLIPEPTVSSMAYLGTAMLLLYRRRK